MLLTLKKDNTTGNFCLTCLLYVHNMVIKSGVICEGVFISNYYMYRWHGSMYVSMYAISYMCSNWDMDIYVDTSKVQMNIILLCVFHNITTSG